MDIKLTTISLNRSLTTLGISGIYAVWNQSKKSGHPRGWALPYKNLFFKGRGGLFGPNLDHCGAIQHNY